MKDGEWGDRSTAGIEAKIKTLMFHARIVASSTRFAHVSVEF
jgi:hypothetical protein